MLSLEDDEKEFVDMSSRAPLKGGEEEVKEGKIIKILTLNKLLTRIPSLLTQIKAGNNLYNFQNKIRYYVLNILYLFHQHKKTTKKLYNDLIKSF